MILATTLMLQLINARHAPLIAQAALALLQANVKVVNLPITTTNPLSVVWLHVLMAILLSLLLTTHAANVMLHANHAQKA